jgi:hypothetical protein
MPKILPSHPENAEAFRIVSVTLAAGKSLLTKL